MQRTWNELHRDFGNDHTILLAAVIHHAAAEISEKLEMLTMLLREKGEQIVSEIDDLNKSLDDLTTGVSNASAELKKIADELVTLANGPTVDRAAVAAAAARAGALAVSLNQAVADAQAEDPTPATPPVTPTP